MPPLVPWIFPVSSRSPLDNLASAVNSIDERVVTLEGLALEGVQGADGQSAYEVAVANGFAGTEVQWLASLVGPQGARGSDGEQGPQGPPGVDGDDGAMGPEGPQGPPGTPGTNGEDGAQGPAGPAPAGTGFVKVNNGVLTVPSASIAQSEVTGLVSALSGKADTSHTHTIANVTSLQSALDAKAATSHAHAISDTTGLQAALDAKQAAGSYATASHNHDATYAPLSHTHTIANVTGLQTALDGKQASGNYAAATHTHAAADIASGTIATARLGSGTANSSSFLRGDQTWAVPSGGSDPWTYVKLGSDFVTSLATAQAVTGLAFTPAANSTYVVEGFFMLRTATATVGPRPGVTWPTGTTDGAAYVDAASTAAAVVIGTGNPSAAVASVNTGVPTTTGSWPATLAATFVTGASPSGALQVTLASETAATNVTMKAGSWIRYRTI